MGTTASKSLHIVSGLDGQHLQTITVPANAKIHDILIQFHQEGKGLVTLLRGKQRLHPDTTVRAAGLKDGEELSLLWSKTYYETATLGDIEDGSTVNVMDQYKDCERGCGHSTCRHMAFELYGLVLYFWLKTPKPASRKD